MKIVLDPKSLDDYRTFLKVKALPIYKIRGRQIEFPDEYASRLGLSDQRRDDVKYSPLHGLFDYQRDISRLAIRKRKFCVFADCGLGKTLIMAEFIRAAVSELERDKCALIVSPLMVIDQTLEEVKRFYGESLEIERVHSSSLNQWLKKGCRIGITNYEALRGDVSSGRLGCLVLDESSMLKSHYGKYGTECIRLGRGLEWKMAGTGTPAPNDRIEYANHAVFMDAFPNTNAFLARFFINRGQTNERWELRPHALVPFYRALSHWAIFLSNPAVYGWKDNCETLPPIHATIHDIALTDEQHVAVGRETGELFASNFGGITSRAKLARIAKGNHDGRDIETLKPTFICDLCESFKNESAIVWCKYNDEQESLARLMPKAANISGDTPHDERLQLIREFKNGKRRILISKPKILGFGLNLQRATRQVFSTLQDSYEEYYQAVKRSNRYGATWPLNVHIPVTELEIPMVENVLRKAGRVTQDTAEQERIFREYGYANW
jgi:hypothetical protein